MMITGIKDKDWKDADGHDNLLLCRLVDLGRRAQALMKLPTQCEDEYDKDDTVLCAYRTGYMAGREFANKFLNCGGKMSPKVTKIKFIKVKTDWDALVPKLPKHFGELPKLPKHLGSLQRCIKCGRKLRNKQQGICSACLFEIGGIKEGDWYKRELLYAGEFVSILPRGDVLNALRRVYDHALTGR